MIISTRGRTCYGRWYPSPDRYVIFVNKIAEDFDPEIDFDGFLSELLATEFHELGHIYGFRNGCKRCKKEFCYWCFFTISMFMFFRYKDLPVEELNKFLKGLKKDD